MRHRLIAILLISAISLGMLFPRLSGVAKADTISFNPGDILYWDDFTEYVYSIASSSQTADLNTIFNYCSTWWDPSEGYDVNIFVILEDADNFTFLVCTWGPTSSNSIWGISYFEQLTDPYWQLRTLNNNNPSNNVYISTRGYFKVVNGILSNVSTLRTTQTIPYRYGSLDISSTIDPFYWYPCPFDGASGLKCYCLRDIVGVPGGSTLLASNISEGNAPPDYVEFNIVTFYLGERIYFTFKEQDIFRDIEPEHLDYMLGVFHDNSDSSELFTWEDVSLLPGAENFTNIDWRSASPMGIYAIDITNKGWVVIDMAHLIVFDENLNASYAGYAINTPYRIGDENPEPGTNGTPDSYTEVFNNWNTYITNYPNSPIVPQDLVPQFYNTQAASCKPCEVAPPSSLWNARHEVTTFGQDIFEYHFPLVSSPAYNYELFDVCVLSRQGIIGDVLQLDYTLYWWYSDSSTPKSTKIQDVNFDILMEMFDIIIVVDDPDYVLIESLPDGDVVYTGDYEYGFTYSPDAFTHEHVLYGFAFITEKAVQKQLLFNFNDGIRKTYDLMEQYIDKRSAWDNSFLDWTLTLFNQYQTIYGKLDDIYNFLFNWDSIFKSISDKLDTLISNTDNSNPDQWYLSLWNFISQFTPSNSDFANGLDEITTTFDDIPLLPEPSAAPTLPLIGG